MRMGSVRDLMGMQPVLLEPDKGGPNVAYWVFNQVTTDESWANMTIITPGRYGKEFPMTFGHYHGAQVEEKYRVVSGEGVVQLQKKFVDNGAWVSDQVAEVLLVGAKAGEELTIIPEFGHSWSNVGPEPLVLLDNWTAGHEAGDYAVVERLKGLSYYLTEVDGKIVVEKNTNYKNTPEAKWLTAEEFNKR